MLSKTLMQTKTLFLAAGHSDSDPGAVANGTTEARIVLKLRDLIAGGWLSNNVVYAKDGARGENLPLRSAITLAKKHDVALELHCNAATPQASGVETINNPETDELAAKLCEVVSRELGIPNRGVKRPSYTRHSRVGFVDDGGGVLLELFFLTNKDDLAKYEAKKLAVAEAIARVLIDAVTEPHK